MNGSGERARVIMARLMDYSSAVGQERQVAKADVYAKIAIAEALQEIAKQLKFSSARGEQ